MVLARSDRQRSSGSNFKILVDHHDFAVVHIDKLEVILEKERYDTVFFFRGDGTVPMNLENQAPGLPQTYEIAVPDAFVDEVDAAFFGHHLMVFRHDRHQLRLASDVTDRIQKAAQWLRLFLGIVFHDVFVILTLSVVVFEPEDPLVVDGGLNDIGPVEFTDDPEQLVAVSFPRERSHRQEVVVLVQIDLQTTVLSHEDHVMETIDVELLIELVVIRPGPFCAFRVQNDHRRGFGLVFQQVDVAAEKSQVGDIPATFRPIKVTARRHAHFLQAVVLFPHLETDVEGILLQLFRHEAHDGVLIADTGIIQVNLLGVVIDGQRVTSFSIAAGAVGSVEHADVHILHAEVAINHGFGLCTQRSKQAQKHYDDKGSFHGNKVSKLVNRFCPLNRVI